MMTNRFGDVYWINNCYNEGNRHIHVSVYLINEGDNYILIDTGSFYHEEEIKSQVEQITDDIRAIVLTHSDLHHSENTNIIRKQFGDAELFTSFTGSTASPEILGMGSAIQCKMGESMDIAGRKVGFPWPPLADRVQTTWIFDHKSKTLFAADGFGHYHNPEDCNLIANEYGNGIPYEGIAAFHQNTLPWLKYIHPNKLIEGLNNLIETWGVENVAPIHGSPIIGGLDNYMDDLEAIIASSANEYVYPSDRT